MYGGIYKIKQTKGMVQQMKKLTHFLTEHAQALVITAIAIVTLILILIVFALVWSGNNDRKLKIVDISGSAFILKSDGQIPADKNTVLENGDVIITSSDGEVKLAADKDKYIYIEPDTTLYVNFTDVSEKGSIIVNISEGSAICRLDSKLGKNTAFEVRTPNAVVSAAGTVFRTDFTYLDSYGGHDAVKLTEVECAQGSVNIQLYDDSAAPADQLMMLAEGKSARLMTCADLARFEYLNSNTDLYSLTDETLRTYIRISADRPLAYFGNDLNNAYQAVLGIGVTAEPAPPVTESISETTPPAETAASADTTPASFTAVIPETVITTETSASEQTVSETTAETTETSESAATAVTTSVSTGTTPISVAETTKKVFHVTTAAQSETTLSESASEPAVTTVPPITAAETTQTLPPQTSLTEPEQTTVVPIKPAEPVTTTTTEAVTTAAPSTEPVPSETTVPESTIPWWEIINSAALTSAS